VNEQTFPIPQTFPLIKIASSLDQPAPAQDRKCQEHEGKIAKVQSERNRFARKLNECLDCKWQNGQTEQKNEIDYDFEGIGNEMIMENPVMLQPHPANDRERDDKRNHTCRVEDVSGVGWHIESKCQQRKAKSEYKIAERFQAPGKPLPLPCRGETRKKKTHAPRFCAGLSNDTIAGNESGTSGFMINLRMGFL
jgi:hypothetical protein